MIKKAVRWLVIFSLINSVLPEAIATSDTHEISSITVLADSRLAIPLSELASLFSHENMVSVAGIYGVSEAQKKEIEDGEAADLFITSDADLVQQLKVKGMVDVHSIGHVASHHDVHFTAAVVAGENMTPAREFLAFLKSEEGRKIFKKNGLSAP